MTLRLFLYNKKKLIEKEIINEATLRLIRRLERIKSKNFLLKTNKQDVVIVLFHSVREFLSIVFKIDYEFTYEEIKKEIDKKIKNNELKKELSLLIQDIEEKEYAGVLEEIKDNKCFSREINKLISKIEDIILKNKETIIKELSELKERDNVKTRGVFPKRITASRKLSKNNKIGSISNKKTLSRCENTEVSDGGFSTIIQNSKIELIYKLLLETNELLDCYQDKKTCKDEFTNRDIIKRIINNYNKIRRYYITLNKEEKTLIHNEIIELYNRILQETKRISYNPKHNSINHKNN